MHSDEKRFERLFQALSNPNHPFSQFSTGNRETIKGKHRKLKVLREKVIDYYFKYYIARNIKIVVYGNYEIESIKKLLIKNMIMAENNSKDSSYSNKDNNNKDNSKDNNKKKTIKNYYHDNEIFMFSKEEKVNNN